MTITKISTKIQNCYSCEPKAPCPTLATGGSIDVGVEFTIVYWGCAKCLTWVRRGIEREQVPEVLKWMY